MPRGNVLEIRFLGRGGQGAVLAAELLAEAAFLDGKVPQSFPFFGVERRGAPVTAYCRLHEGPIAVRGSITEPDVLVVLDRSLLRNPGATSGLKDGGWLVVNAPSSVRAFPAPAGVRLAAVDASRIAVEHHLGSATLPIVNTVVLGALARLTGAVTLPALERAIEHHVPRNPEANREACRDGYAQVQVLEGAASRLPPVPARSAAVLTLPEGPVASASSERISTASWRTLRPEIHLEKCTRCNFCWKYCPDVAIDLDAQGFPVLLEEHCKGCGICADICPPKAIALVAEA